MFRLYQWWDYCFVTPYIVAFVRQAELEARLQKTLERMGELESEASGAKRAKDSISGEAAAYVAELSRDQ